MLPEGIIENKKIKTCVSRETESYEVNWKVPDQNIDLSSSVVSTKSLGKRNVLISTVNLILGISKDVNVKPGIYKLYDYTKSGTDIVH